MFEMIKRVIGMRQRAPYLTFEHAEARLGTAAEETGATSTDHPAFSEFAEEVGAVCGEASDAIFDRRGRWFGRRESREQARDGEKIFALAAEMLEERNEERDASTLREMAQTLTLDRLLHEVLDARNEDLLSSLRSMGKPDTETE